MEVDADDDVLQALAQGGQMEYEKWPGLLSRLLPRLEKIVNEQFPAPSIPPQIIPSSQGTTQSSPSQSSTQSSNANKENAPPPPPATTLPPQILTLLSSITTTLTSLFSTHPPHTIQRLAELLLNPKQHYRTLPSYLHALDRVVHVSSGAHIFPLPPAIPDPSSATILSNGAIASGVDPLSISWSNSTQAGLGSDESLGGALLTPISWLTAKSTNGTDSPLEGEVKSESTQMVDGPNGPGGVETVSVSVNGISSPREGKEITMDTVASLRAEGGVTQGELLRQEQRAGVVPATQLHGHRGGDSDGLGEEDELPHARGPEEIGAEDIGTQDASSSTLRGGPGMGLQGIDVEAAVGRSSEPMTGDDDEAEDEEAGEGLLAEDTKMEDGNRTPKREAEDEQSGDEKRVKEDKDDDVDVESVSADAENEKTEEAAKEAAKESDEIDTTSV